MAGLKMVQDGEELGSDLDWVRAMVGKGEWGGWGGRVETLFEEMSRGGEVIAGKCGGVSGGEEEGGGKDGGGMDGVDDGNGGTEGEAAEADWSVGESDLEDGEWDMKSEYGEGAVDESW